MESLASSQRYLSSKNKSSNKQIFLTDIILQKQIQASYNKNICSTLHYYKGRHAKHTCILTPGFEEQNQHNRSLSLSNLIDFMGVSKTQHCLFSFSFRRGGFTLKPSNSLEQNVTPTQNCVALLRASRCILFLWNPGKPGLRSMLPISHSTPVFPIHRKHLIKIQWGASHPGPSEVQSGTGRDFAKSRAPGIFRDGISLIFSSRDWWNPGIFRDGINLKFSSQDLNLFKY